MERKIIYISVVSLLFLLLATNCGEKNEATMKMLQKAESLLETNPDSALATIGAIPVEAINSEKIKARFFLVYEEILDRNGIRLIGEEYMIATVAYFNKYGTAQEKFLSNYYLGELYYQNGNTYDAMQQYVIAEDFINKSGRETAAQVQEKNSGHLLRLHTRRGDIFMEHLNPASAIRVYEKGLGIAKSATEKMKISGKLALAYQSLEKNQEALQMYESACNLAIELDSTSHMLKYLTAIEGIKFSMGESSANVLQELYIIYNRYNNGVPIEDNYIMLSCLHLDNGKPEKAEEYLKLYKKSNSTITPAETAGIAQLSSSIAKAKGNYKEALKYQEEYNEIMATIMEQEKAKSINHIEQTYYAKELAIENQAIKTNNRHMLIIYTLIVVILLGSGCTALIIWRKKISEKDYQIRNYLDQLEDSEISNNMLVSQLDIHKEKEKHLKELLENRFAEIRELAGTYYEFGYSKKLQKKVEQLLSLQSIGGDMFNIIEEVVNAKNNDVIKKIKVAYPTISPDNIKLLNLIYAGFSPQEISVIINDTPQNIYVRKSRLKRKIMPLVEQDPEMDFK